ncbi:MAG TPA: hypothetical protein VLB74_08415 [Flavobacterium sp.]|uniref:FKBP-type peptidyl-prolyl cis-trans isomerase n=1 Tax=Flavobacterium sp. TaxID=239 RepID=UPI002B5D4DA5|nr:FKBP-type peptidylprolyl isomerase [Flavobacterium sp.]HSD14658.1 hypothetical protein [Flavobacterium sp.]
MNKILFGLGIALLLLGTSCKDDDTPQAEPARPHADVYPEDLVDIEDYLHKAYVEVTRNAGGDVIDVKIDTLDADHTVSIWDQTDYPLMSKIVKLYGVDFKVYYLKFDDKGDTDADGDKPCGVDRILTTYRGTTIVRTAVVDPDTDLTSYVFENKEFDYAPNPVEFNLIDVIKGWEHVMPLFRAGFFDPNDIDGTLNSINYGSGAMFLPSGLGYYNGAGVNGSIPAYTPLIFTFNLHAVTRLDQDFDKIESRYEYELDEDGNLIDTDADGIPDIFDADDDNDGYLTKNEITHTVTVLENGVETVYRYVYPFNGAAVDDPVTIYVDEAQGIPDCSLDYATPTRVRRHLDKNCFAIINEDLP